MNYPDIDVRTKKDILNRLKRLASSYAPEWKFDENHPDVGTVLSYIYADMFEGTVHRFNKVAEKNRIAFFDCVGAKLLPGVPASGYASFALVNDLVGGTRVKKGTRVLAEETDTQARQVFETQNDLFVTPARVCDVWITNGEKDQIFSVYQERKGDEWKPFYPFKERLDNLEEHILYFNQDILFNIQKTAVLFVEFQFYRQKEGGEEWFPYLMDDKLVTFEYSSEAGYTKMPNRTRSGSRLEFLIQEGMPVPARREEGGIESFWIRMKIHDIHVFEYFYPEQVLLGTIGKKLKPDVIHNDGLDLNPIRFYPYGERFTVLSELYFACGEALSKKGAEITLSFRMGFERFTINEGMEEPEVDWKPIMRKKAFQPVPEYDITIEQIVWEYFNGDGWHRLFQDDSYSDLFGIAHGTEERMISLHFQCPEDIEEILISSLSSYYIRARIIKVNNAYKQNGYYVSPYAEEVRFQYDYTKKEKKPAYYLSKNHLEMRAYRWDVKNPERKWQPFQKLREKRSTLYLGFQTALSEGPVRILFQLAGSIRGQLPRIQMEYSTGQDWKPLNAFDETEYFKKTGILTLMGNSDFLEMDVFGEKRYWIRFVDIDSQYDKYKGDLPQIVQMVMNTTEISATQKMPVENFFIEPKTENFQCRLLYNKLYHVSVWVNEQSVLGTMERKELLQKYPVRITKNDNGEQTGFWVQWKEVEDFSQSKSSDRHYLADRIHGLVTFSDGKHGAIPSSGEQETIRIEYSLGGGERGNLPSDSISGMEETLGFIHQVRNPLHTGGGCDQETIQQAVERSARALRHGGRAVTPKDYEDLALAASRSIIKAKCFANTNENGEHEPGCVTIAILLKQMEDSGQFYESVKDQVYKEMKDAVSGNLMELGKFHIVKPRFLYLNVSVLLTVREHNQVFDVKDGVMDSLKEFLHPVSGNFNHRGFEIGIIPNMTQIANAIKTVSGILYIKDLRMVAYSMDKGEMSEVDLESLEQNCFALVLSGTHTVSIEVENR